MVHYWVVGGNVVKKTEKFCRTNKDHFQRFLLIPGTSVTCCACKETGSGNINKVQQRTFYSENLCLSTYRSLLNIYRYIRHFSLLHKHNIKRTFDLSCLIEISVTTRSYFSNLSEYKRNY